MKRYFYPSIIALLGLGLFACEDVADNVIPHIASPVLLETTDLSADSTLSQVEAAFYELDKRGILNSSVGIDSIPITDLSVEVFAGEVLLGEYVTDDTGRFTVTYDPTNLPGSLAWAGTYNEVAFRIE